MWSNVKPLYCIRTVFPLFDVSFSNKPIIDLVANGYTNFINLWFRRLNLSKCWKIAEVIVIVFYGNKSFYFMKLLDSVITF